MKRFSFFLMIITVLYLFYISGLCVANDLNTSEDHIDGNLYSSEEILGEEPILTLDSTPETREWRSGSLSFPSRKLFRLSYKAVMTRDRTKGCFCAGTNFFNVDHNWLPYDLNACRENSVVFFTGDGSEGKCDASIRFAKWESDAEYKVSSPRVNEVCPIYAAIPCGASENLASRDVLILGAGESINQQGEYSFTTFTNSEQTNFDKPLVSTNCHFNTGRWIFSNENYSIYSFSFKPKRLGSCNIDGVGQISESEAILFTPRNLSVDVGYYVGGRLVVEASSDGENWKTLGTIEKLASQSFDLATLGDDSLLDSLFIRLRGEKTEDAECLLQVYSIKVDLGLAQTEGSEFVGEGATIFADFADEHVETGIDASPCFFDSQGIWALTPDENSYLFYAWDTEGLKHRGSAEILEEERTLSFKYKLNTKRAVYLERRIPSFFIQNYTKKIKGVKGTTGTNISWCEADYSVPRTPLTCEILDEQPILLHSAGNDYQSFQIILNANEKDIHGLSAKILDDLKNKNGDVLSKENVQLRYAYYHYVSEPSDKTCAKGFYPDALVPLEKGEDGMGAPLQVLKGNNFPIWITVYTPSGMEKGVYTGRVAISGNDGSFYVEAPFAVKVWGFDLPKKNTFETAYGMSFGNIWRYHNCETEEEKRQVLESYLEAFGKYRISTYSPAPLDPIQIKWRPDTNPPSCDLDFTAFDKEMLRVFDKYNFTNFTIHVPGIGSGNQEARYEGEIAGFKSGSPEYESMMSDFGTKLQNHLQEIGLLQAAYTYNFDEPEEKDFEFVAKELAKIGKYLPFVSRMLTEEPSQKFEEILDQYGGNVSIWCPISNAYNSTASMEQRRKGNRFWWYVCTGPKAPYCTEFIDHPTQELRMWHWQAFQRDIVGSLIWDTTYWTSPTAFTESYQNPYSDPMSYQTGYGLAMGSKRGWGNGDGRFIYPPLSAAVPGMNNGKVVLDEPNVSIRWEMIRLGIQDVEMCYILKDLFEKNKEKISVERQAAVEKLLDFTPITTDATHFSQDPQVLLKRRIQIGNAIEYLLGL